MHAGGGKRCGCPGKISPNICDILEDGHGPLAFVVENPGITQKRSSGKPLPTQRESIGISGINWGFSYVAGPESESGTTYAEGPVITWVEFRHQICSTNTNSSVRQLAKAILHESLHQLKHTLGDVRTTKDYPSYTKDLPWFHPGTDAEEQVEECFGVPSDD